MPNVGRARLNVAVRDGKSVVTQQFGKAPLQVHAPLYLEKAPFPTVFLRSPSAGLLGGDEHDLHITVEDGASLEVRTQAATQVYPGQSRQTIFIDVGKNAYLEFLPHQLILSKAAHLSQRITIKLADTSSRLLFREHWCAGRIAMNERWQFERFDNHSEVLRGDRLVYRERFCLEPAEIDVSSDLVCGEYTHFQTVYQFGVNELQQDTQPDSRVWSMRRDGATITRVAEKF